MRCNVETALCICLLFMGLSAHDGSKKTSIQDQQEMGAITRRISPEEALCFLKESFAIIDLIDQIDQESQNKLGVLCIGCHAKILGCAELGGHLCATVDQKNIDILKELLAEKNITKINAFVLAVAQEKQIACAECQKYVGWVERNS